VQIDCSYMDSGFGCDSFTLLAAVLQGAIATVPSGRYTLPVPSSAHDRVLNAAEARLLAMGPAGLVLDAIASDAGVSKGGLLYHFPNKEALVAGLCDRMLERFDLELAALKEREGDGAGAFVRAYLASTVTPEGRPADNSAQLMAGLLAVLGRDSAHLAAVRDRFAQWHQALLDDGLDDTTATIIRLAADGLWLSALLGLPTISGDLGTRTVRALKTLATKD
jgi:AcrR family transcriptional regulator